jgi:hypothetical protein
VDPLTKKPVPLLAYASIEEFYEARGTRFGWSEVDYGGGWRWSSSRRPPRYRVTYVRGSGEIYVMQFGGRQNGRVEVYGQTDDYATLEQILAGWWEHCERPRSLLWLVGRLKEAGLDRERRRRLSPLAV